MVARQEQRSDIGFCSPSVKRELNNVFAEDIFETQICILMTESCIDSLEECRREGELFEKLFWLFHC